MELVGGLGNQFFGYFAGMAHSLTFKKKILFNLQNTNESLNSLETINSLELPGNFTELSVARSFTSKFLPNFYVSPELGFDITILTNKKLKVICGYYQTFKYYEIFKQYFPEWEPKLKNESEYFKRVTKIVREENPFSIHLRRGDYRKLRDSFGLLSFNYYLDAVKSATQEFGESSILVFGDDHQENNLLKEELIRHGFRASVIHPPVSSPPMESLILMSMCRLNIIGNSTFGWWGARFNPNPLAVYIPSPWFKTLNEPRDLFPANWNASISSWE